MDTKLVCRLGILSVALLAASALNALSAESWRTEAQRVKDRATYASVVLSDSVSPRQVVDLTGKWLFKPSQELDASQSGSDPKSPDASWHVLDVPQMWTPIAWASFRPDGQGSFLQQIREKARCDRFTFDYAKTGSGWYRQWFDLPASMKGKRFILRFNGVAVVSKVYWNGKAVGGHLGMFGPFECEVTKQIRFGEKNLLSVFVSSGKVDAEIAKKVTDVAVTVEVTNDMVNGLPKGFFMYTPNAGIWKPAQLIVTGPCRIADFYFKSRLDGASIRTTVDGRFCKLMKIRHTITDSSTGQVLYHGTWDAVVPMGEGSIDLDANISGLKPKLWSPEHPNCYTLKTELLCGDTVADEKTTTVGFKTFQVKGDKIYLNGKPYFMRGSNQPPQGIAPCDKALADTFIKFMHDGNEMFTRFHGCPPSDVWLDACDKNGVGASVAGQWPWVLIGANAIPAPELVKAWNEEWLECVRAYRNHPSVCMWTLNNENYFTGKSDPDKIRKTEKFRIFSDLTKATRQETPDKPIVFFSGYRRFSPDYDDFIKPNKFDDGDINDKHNYFSWYGKSWHLIDVPKEVEDIGAIPAGRPIISQESAVPYSNTDEGHCIWDYQTKGRAWVGHYSAFTSRPDYFLETTAQITKEYMEKIRRDKTMLSGYCLFCTYCWFKDPFDPETVTPFPVYWEAKKAMSPVLVSMELDNRHFMAGEKFKSQVYIMNDDTDRDMLKDLTLEWRIYGKSTDAQMWTSGAVQMPNCAYYGKCKKEVDLQVPEKLPFDRSNMVLEFTLMQGREIIARNTYPLICATPAWVASDKTLTVLESDGKTGAYLQSLGAKCDSRGSVDWASLDSKSLVVVASGTGKAALSGMSDFVRKGGRVLMLEPNAEAVSAIPDVASGQIKVAGSLGDFVDLESPQIMDGMDPMDMHWLNAMPGEVVRCCKTSYQFADTPGVAKLATFVSPHAYIAASDVPKQFSWPVFEVSSGQGRVLVSSILLSDDPIAKRTLRNEMQYLAR